MSLEMMFQMFSHVNSTLEERTGQFLRLACITHICVFGFEILNSQNLAETVQQSFQQNFQQNIAKFVKDSIFGSEIFV